jgi:type I restriction enzyme, S subunit
MSQKGFKESRSLPTGWEFAEIEQICESKVQQRCPADLPVPYIDISAIDRQNKTIGKLETVTSQNAPSRAKQWVKQGDILVSMTRPNLNAVALVPKSLNGAVASTGFDVIRPIGILPKWVFNWVRTREFVIDICKGLQGVVYPAIRPQDIRKHIMPIAPISEQSRIVAAIDDHFSRLDEAVMLLERVQRNLKRYRASVLKAAVEGRLVPTEAELARAEGRDYEPASVLLERILAERHRHWHKSSRGNHEDPAAYDITDLPNLPEGWCWSSPDQLASYKKYSLGIGPFGSNLKVCDYKSSGIPLVFVKNIRNGSFAGPDTKFISLEKAKDLKPHIAKAGDILITKMGEPPGDACLYPLDCPECVITADCIKWRLQQDFLYIPFFVHAINSQLVREQIIKRTKGVAQKKISLARFKNVAIPLPPITEQKRICMEIERLESVMILEMKSVKDNATRCHKLRQSILKQAFEGKLVDQDPADEPVSVLLERIRAERAAAAIKTQPKKLRRKALERKA